MKPRLHSAAWSAPLANVEMVKTPKAGAVLYDVRPGHRVEEGARLATIIFAPGEEDGALDILAPQSGYVLTRRSTRALRAGDDVLKLVGDRPSAVAKSGALEANETASGRLRRCGSLQPRDLGLQLGDAPVAQLERGGDVGRLEALRDVLRAVANPRPRP